MVGGGLAGTEVALQAIRSGARTLILEAGPHRGTDHVAARPTTRGLLDREADPDFRTSVPSSACITTAGLRQRYGGRGLYWRGIVLPIEATSLEAWPESVQRRLLARKTIGSYTDTLAYLTDWAQRELDVPAHVAEDAFLDWVSTSGLSARVTPRAVRHRADGSWEAYSAAALVPSGTTQAETTVRALSPEADHISIEVGDSSGQVGHVSAAMVVLCAGTFANISLTQRLLHRIGVQHQPRIRVVDHAAAGWVQVRPTPLTSTHTRVERESSIFLGHRSAAGSNVFLEATEQEDKIVLDAWAMAEQLPVDGIDVHDGVRSGLAVFQSERSRRSYQESLDRQKPELLEVADALRVKVEHYAGDGFDDAYARALSLPGRAFGYQEASGDLDHESGGLALGSDLVDTGGRLRADPRILLGGPSVFPRAGAANPSLTTLALARQLPIKIPGFPDVKES